MEPELLQYVLCCSRKPSDATLQDRVSFCGPVNDGDEVGDKVCCEMMFLQDPENGAKNVEYRNPYVI